VCDERGGSVHKNRQPQPNYSLEYQLPNHSSYSEEEEDGSYTRDEEVALAIIVCRRRDPRYYTDAEAHAEADVNQP
jgi:hypothetical protein